MLNSTVFIALLLACPGCPLAAVVINGIMDRPLSERHEHKYVELFNTGDMAKDLSDWSFSKGISYHFPYGGTKDSGLGREGVSSSVEEMTEPRILVTNLNH